MSRFTLPTKTLQAIEEFFYTRIFLKIGKIKKYTFKIIQSILLLSIIFKKLKKLLLKLSFYFSQKRSPKQNDV